MAGITDQTVDPGAEPDRNLNLAQIREAHLARGKVLAVEDPHAKIQVRARVRTLDNLRKEARVGPWTFLADEAPNLGGAGSAPTPLAYFVASIGFCLLTQLTRACALEELPVDDIDMEIRASFPLESKYGLGTASAGADSITYRVDVKGSNVDPIRLQAAFDWAESVCHVVQTLLEPVAVTTSLELNGAPVSVA